MLNQRCIFFFCGLAILNSGPVLAGTCETTAKVQHVARLTDGGNVLYQSTLTWVSTNMGSYQVERIALAEPITDLGDFAPESVPGPIEFAQLQTQDGVLYAQAARDTLWTRRGEGCIYWEALKLPFADLAHLRTEFPDGLETDGEFSHIAWNEDTGQRYARSIRFDPVTLIITNEAIHAIDASGQSNLVSLATIETQSISLPFPENRIGGLDTDRIICEESLVERLREKFPEREVRVRERLASSTPAQKRAVFRMLQDAQPGLRPYLRGVPRPFIGIGAMVLGNTTEGLSLVTTEYSRSAGLRDGDVLLAVDEVPMAEFSSVNDVLAAIRGPENTEVALTVQRNGVGATTVRALRQEIFLEGQTVSLPPDWISQHTSD